MIFFENLMQNKYYQYTYFIATFLLLTSITAYFYPLYTGHDMDFHIMRLDALIDAIKDKTLPTYVDYKAIYGYGYATKWFYSDLLLIPFAFVALITNTITAYKILLISYTLLCGILSYVSIYKVFKIKYIAFIFCIIYTFSYYRLYDVYNRSALGETICLTFIPLAIWGSYEIIKGNYKKWYILSIAFSLMIFSHINTPVQVAVIVAIFFIINYKSFIKNPIRLIYLGISALVCILLTAYFTFPLIEQMISNNFYYSLTGERAVTFNVMFGEPMKYILRGLFSGITYVVPEIAGIGIVITTFVLIRIFIFKDELIKKADTFLLVGIICLFIISPFYPWQTFPFSIIGFIQFSWRFYTVATIVLSMAGSIYFYHLLKTEKRRYMLGIPFVLIFNSLIVMNSGQVFSNNFNKYENNTNYDTKRLMGAEYLPSNIPNTNTFFHQRANDSVRAVNNKAKVIDFEREVRVVSLSVETNYKDQLELPLVYYKGYTATFNNETIDVKQSENGLIQIAVDTNGKLKVWFGGTMIQKLSPYISLISFVVLIVYIILQNRRNKNAKISEQNIQ